MWKVLLMLKICFARLQIWSPDQLASLSIDNAIATFGDPFVVPRYGRLVGVYSSGSCSFSESLGANTFAVLYGFTGCFFSDLAASTQRSGGIGMINVDSFDDIDFIMVPKDGNSDTSILSITIRQSDGKRISEYLNNQIWATYSFPVDSSATSKIDFQMSSNYTLDKVFIKAFLEISSKFSIDLSHFAITFCFSSPQAVNINYLTDCLTSANSQYCLPHTSTVTGSQKIYNSAVILNYYKTQSGSATPFLTFLTTLYSNCEFDYSTACVQKVLTSVSSGSTADTSLNAFQTSNSWLGLTPFYLINSEFYYFWPGHIEKIYCLSLSSPPSNCEQCNSGCSYEDLFSSTCKSSCNVASCGYNMLNCLSIDGCYSFMRGDGNCNKKCACDIDCGCDKSDICEGECLYSDMEAGKCPLACKGKCFEYCSSEYCSPECTYSDISHGDCSKDCTEECKNNCESDYCSPRCSYKDMQKGECPSACTESCFAYCSSAYCAPGCSYSDLGSGNCLEVCPQKCLDLCDDTCTEGCNYSDMKSGLCPVKCKGKCFDYCSSDFCSPDCSYLDIADGFCPDSCEEKCCKNEENGNKSKSKLIYYIIIAPITIAAIGLIVLSVYIFCRISKRRRLAEEEFQNPESSIILPYTLSPVRFNRNLNFLGDAICTIDLLGFNMGELAIIIPTCKHIFHPLCIHEWLTALRVERRCPNCNSDLAGWIVILD